MKSDELAFFNQQLAGMLRSGIPLEGALRQLCADMNAGRLRDELRKLEADLAQGIPLDKALGSRNLPGFYAKMLQIGVRSNDLPGVLTLVADYYQRRSFLWMRLKGLMVYPSIVLCASIGLSILIASIAHGLGRELFAGIGLPAPAVLQAENQAILLFAPVVVVSLLGLFLFLGMAIPSWRDALSWKIAAFKEANLSNFASSLRLLLQKGGNLKDALAVLGELERNTLLGGEINNWQAALAQGTAKPSTLAAQSRILPPLFFWLVAADGEDWVAGLGRAAETYYSRAIHKAELLLYAALPVSILVLTIFLVAQVVPVVAILTNIMGWLGGGME